MVYIVICSKDLDIWNVDISTNLEDTLYFPHYKPESSETNEYRQTTTENGQKKENRIFRTSD